MLREVNTQPQQHQEAGPQNTGQTNAEALKKTYLDAIAETVGLNQENLRVNFARAEKALESLKVNPDFDPSSLRSYCNELKIIKGSIESILVENELSEFLHDVDPDSNNDSDTIELLKSVHESYAVQANYLSQITRESQRQHRRRRDNHPSQAILQACRESLLTKNDFPRGFLTPNTSSYISDTTREVDPAGNRFNPHESSSFGSSGLTQEILSLESKINTHRLPEANWLKRQALDRFHCRQQTNQLNDIRTERRSRFIQLYDSLASSVEASQNQIDQVYKKLHQIKEGNRVDYTISELRNYLFLIQQIIKITAFNLTMKEKLKGFTKLLDTETRNMDPITIRLDTFNNEQIKPRPTLDKTFECLDLIIIALDYKIIDHNRLMRMDSDADSPFFDEQKEIFTAMQSCLAEILSDYNSNYFSRLMENTSGLPAHLIEGDPESTSNLGIHLAGITTKLEAASELSTPS